MTLGWHEPRVSVAFFVVFPLRVGCACAVWTPAAAPRPARGVSSSDKDPPRTKAKHLESDVERGSHSRSPGCEETRSDPDRRRDRTAVATRALPTARPISDSVESSALRSRGGGGGSPRRPQRNAPRTIPADGGETPHVRARPITNTYARPHRQRLWLTCEPAATSHALDSPPASPAACCAAWAAAA